MVEKYKLNLLVAFIVLLIVIWLIRAGMVWDRVGQLLLLGVAAAEEEEEYEEESEKETQDRTE